MNPAPKYPEAPPCEKVLAHFGARTAFAFSSPTRTLLAASPAAELTEYSELALARTLHDSSVAGCTDACIVGCYPFTGSSTTGDPLNSPTLYLSTNPLKGRAMTRPGTTDNFLSPSPTQVRTNCTPAGFKFPLCGWSSNMRAPHLREHYCRAVATALERIAASDLEKVVLARAVDLVPRLQEAGSPTRLTTSQVVGIVRSALLRSSAKYNFAVRLPTASGTNESRFIFGASPELLLRKSGAQVETFPLAGSIPRTGDTTIDAERARRLLESEKDLREHAFVVEALADTLSPLCKSLTVPRRPELVAAATVWHLGSRVCGVLRDPLQPSYALARMLHPSPAVCGAPTRQALEVIADLERFSRDYFAGIVGWCDAKGDGEWAVTIRCGEITPGRLRLYAGAGIVDGSIPEAELAETDAKLLTLLNLLGVDASVREIC
jgi:isochorismate synthase